MDRPSIMREVNDVLGSVPKFIEAIPDAHLDWMWGSMHHMQLLPGEIPAKYQQLVMLAVSTYAKCKYCTDFHTEAAKALGASEREIREVALLTGHTASFSNYLGGTQYDYELFKHEVRAICQVLSGNGHAARPRDRPSAPSARPRGQ
jgi:AhpD family alkylhydroperoxidase